MPANYFETKAFKEKHKACKLEVITNKTGVDAILMCHDHNIGIDTYIAYPLSLCVNPSQCVGLTSCPRNYSCSE